MDIHDKFQELIAVMEDAGKYAKAYFDSDSTDTEHKSDGSMVTEIDTKIENLLREHIANEFPEDTIIGEEGDTKQGVNEFVWFIDPIDGTDNFIRRIPLFTVTAVRLGPTPEDTMAVVHNPISGQTFASLKEDGIYENERICNFSAETIQERKLVYISAKSTPGSWTLKAKASLIKGLSLKFGKGGALNSALLEFAYVAAGRLDGYVQLDMRGWDSAAGLYLVRAAGGAISVFKDGEWLRYDGLIQDLYGEDYEGRPSLIASHPSIHDQLTAFVGDPKSWAT